MNEHDMLYDEIRKSHKNNKFRPKSIPDFSSDFKFQTNIFSCFRKITAISIAHNVEKQRDQKWCFPVVKGLRSELCFKKMQITWISRHTFKTRLQ